MKVLLIEEFSSLHLNLKKGLEEIGHSVDIAASGDGFKSIQRDIDLNSKYTGIVGYCIKCIKAIKLIRHFNDYDVIQFVNPYSAVTFILMVFKYFIKLDNLNICVLSAGDDVQFIEYGNQGGFKYWPYGKPHSPPSQYLKPGIVTLMNKFLLSNCKKYIPVMYEYGISSRHSIYADKVTETIPLPFDINHLTFENVYSDKIVIFHGILREEFKGSEIILQALNKIKHIYPTKVEIIIDGKMPLDDYYKVLNKVDILVDQCKSYSYGMNAIIGMAMGKAVLSGNEKECQIEFGISEIPVINILPESEDIFNKLEFLILNPLELQAIGNRSRDFVKENHNCIKVAKKYVEIWAN